MIATATDLDGRPLLLKAWVDPARYRHEVDALRLWAGGPTADVLEAADDLAVAALELVGGGPGERIGRRVRRRWSPLPFRDSTPSGGAETDRTTSPARHLPRRGSLPRIRRREHALDTGAWRPLVDATLPALTDLEEDPSRVTVLHADLYRENVPFDWLAHPRLIDPLPMVGDPAFDWAFWTVYYDLARGTGERLTTASRISRIPIPGLAPWCRLLALDGLLFYLETDDPRAPQMAGVLSDLSASTPRSGT
ncbi:phosphotransferase [Streptomyces sp. MS1.HAVA.3]|uniref:Phosphotransferase n=1 Tax=Streptomyces caledonius TaxID=3134107 RepID=A0ABU8U6W6_9ACTN